MKKFKLSDSLNSAVFKVMTAMLSLFLAGCPETGAPTTTASTISSEKSSQTKRPTSDVDTSSAPHNTQEESNIPPIVPFFPGDLPGLHYWIDASEPTSLHMDNAATLPASDNSVVKSWASKRGDTVRFTSNFSQYPIFRQSAINGKPAVEFSMNDTGGAGTPLCLSANADGIGCTMIFTAPKTLFSVVKILQNTDYWQVVYSTRDYGITTWMGLTIGAPGYYNFELNFYGAGTFTGYPQNSRVFKKPTIVVHSSDQNGATPFFLGGALGHWIPLSGYLAELIVYEGIMPEADSSKVVDYLSQKYSIPKVYDPNSIYGDGNKWLPVAVAAGLAFTDTDTTVGELGGTVTVTKATSERNVDGYRLYFADAAGKKIGLPINTAPKTGANLTITIPANTVIPSGAAKLLVVTVNHDGEATKGISISFTDS